MVEQITVTFHLDNGTTVDGIIYDDGSWHQWGADREVLGVTRDFIADMAEATVLNFEEED